MQLIITSINGCTDTIIKPQIINALTNTPDFIANDTIGCRPFNVFFSDLSSSANQHLDLKRRCDARCDIRNYGTMERRHATCDWIAGNDDCQNFERDCPETTLPKCIFMGK